MNKVIVITGTRKGIGKDLSEYYLQTRAYRVRCSRGKRKYRISQL